MNEAPATWLTIKEAARLLNIGKPTRYQMSLDGKAPAQNLGRAWWLDADDLDSWLKNGKARLRFTQEGIRSRTNGPEIF